MHAYDQKVLGEALEVYEGMMKFWEVAQLSTDSERTIATERLESIERIRVEFDIPIEVQVIE